jgi:hypothetical protein
MWWTAHAMCDVFFCAIFQGERHPSPPYPPLPYSRTMGSIGGHWGLPLFKSSLPDPIWRRPQRNLAKSEGLFPIMMNTHFTHCQAVFDGCRTRWFHQMVRWRLRSCSNSPAAWKEGGRRTAESAIKIMESSSSMNTAVLTKTARKKSLPDIICQVTR